MPDVADVRTCTTGDLNQAELVAIRRLLDEAFGGRFDDHDWQHSLGGVHALIAQHDAVVAHASVVPRALTIGDRTLDAGYVEAVAVLPSSQRGGLGSAVMAALHSTMSDRFELGALSTGAWEFYGRLGWQRWQGPTWVRHADGTLERTHDEDDGVMILRLPNSPPFDVGARIICDERPGDSW